MKVSVVIVSYNVRYFLEQCLFSVRKALRGIPSEIFVVDNHSTDDSILYLKTKFPETRFLENDRNVGFSRANNQVLASISGDFVHFLNPDTILPEDFYEISLAFMDAHPRAGSLGPRMLDGSGIYLPESKRGAPTLWNAFCKMSGLWQVFSKKGAFSGYYRGDLPENQENRVETLSGASMFIRKPLLDEIGGFDERYFMYGEDIDLSFSILSKGYENWYVPEITMLHFKGESTHKNSTYWQYFYESMLLFIEKHEKGVFAGFKKWVISGIIQKMLQNAQKSSKRQENQPKVRKNEEKSMILLKEGESLSFKQIIAQIHLNGTSVHYMIQSNGSESMVGSKTPENRGNAVPL